MAMERAASEEQWVAPEEARVFGRHDYVELPLNLVVRLPQVRETVNPELHKLTDDIDTNDLMNAVDVARLSDVQLKDYIDFVNRTWGRNVKLQDFAAQRLRDGTYWLLIAGHTRLEAITQINDRAQPDEPFYITAKVHYITTPDQIIARQIAENTHRQPSQERRAMAVVEMYRWGIEHRKWAGPADFLERMRGQVSKTVLYEAIAFAELPLEARNLVFAGQVAYKAAVALGQGSETIFRYAAANLGYYHNEQAAPHGELQNAYNLEIARILTHIKRETLNDTFAKRYVTNQLADMVAHLAKLEAMLAKTDQPALPWDEVAEPPELQTERYLRELRKKLELAMRQMMTTSVEDTRTAIELLTELGDGSDAESLQREYERRRNAFGGRLATNGKLWEM